VSPLRGENPIFGPMSKNNTGMAALRADLPVNITKLENLNSDCKSVAGMGKCVVFTATL